MRLRDRPWKLLAIALLLTLGLAYVAVDLSDGIYVTRRGRVLTSAGTPVRFALQCATILLAVGGAVLAWVAVAGEWNSDYRPRWKLGFVDEERRREPPTP